MTKEWVNDIFCALDRYSDLKYALNHISEALQAEKDGIWKDLELDIQEGYGGSYDIVIVGKRPETDLEKKNRLRNKAIFEASERDEYKRLKKKFEGE